MTRYPTDIQRLAPSHPRPPYLWIFLALVAILGAILVQTGHLDAAQWLRLVGVGL